MHPSMTCYTWKGIHEILGVCGIGDLLLSGRGGESLTRKQPVTRGIKLVLHCGSHLLVEILMIGYVMAVIS